MVASRLLRCGRNKDKPRRKNILNCWLTFSRKVSNAELVLMLRHILDSQWAADLKQARWCWSKLRWLEGATVNFRPISDDAWFWFGGKVYCHRWRTLEARTVTVASEDKYASCAIWQTVRHPCYKNVAEMSPGYYRCRPAWRYRQSASGWTRNIRSSTRVLRLWITV